MLDINCKIVLVLNIFTKWMKSYMSYVHVKVAHGNKLLSRSFDKINQTRSFSRSDKKEY